MQSFFLKSMAVALGTLLTTCGSVSAQVGFSLPPHAAIQQVSAAEYFFDTDPGTGNGLPMAITSAADVNTSFSANISGLSKGAHQLFVRTRNGAGQWSFANSVTFVTYTMMNALPAIASGAQVSAAEYFIDTEPGIGNGTAIVLPAPGVDVTASNVAVNTSGLSLGVHRVFFRSRNAAGQWSLSTSSAFTILVASLSNLPAHPSGKLVSTLEYFIDTDPGYCAGTIISVTPTVDLVGQSLVVPISLLADGNHTLFMRSLNGRSLTTAKTFQVGGTALPLKWLIVDGRLEGNTVALSWRVNEWSGDGDYVIERSADGNNFSSIGTASRYEDGAHEHNYSFNDREPLEGVGYYRVQQKDGAGKSSYTPVITIRKGDAVADIRINNPVVSMLSIVRIGNAATSGLSIINTTSGKEVMRIARGYERVQQVNVSALPPGLYLLNWTSGALKFLKL